MAARPVQLFSGPDSVRAADEYRKAVQERRDQWPYVHVYPPPNSVDVHVISTLAVPLPAPAAVVTVLTYKVSSGKRFYLRAVLFQVLGTAFAPGDTTFTIDRNSPTGVADTQFNPEHGLVNVPVQLGASTIQPWPLQRAREFSPLDVVRIKATNANLSGGTYVCGLFGYEVPVLDVKYTK